MRLERIGCAVAFALIALAPHAETALISVDDPVFGVDSITLDTATGLSWLDVTLTTDRSFDEVSTAVGSPGDDLFGWRHATEDEVLDLWRNADVPDINAPFVFTADNFVPVSELIALLGGFTSGSPNLSAESQGIIDEPRGLDSKAIGRLIVDHVATTGRATTDAFAAPRDSAAAELGHYLVRPFTVPEPSTVLLLWAGMAGLALGRKSSRGM